MEGAEAKASAAQPLLELSVAAGAPVYWEEEELCLHEAIAAQARRTPALTALEDEERPPLTYAEMMHEAECLARLLQHEKGLKPGEVVGLLAPQNSDWVVAVLAIWITGAAVQPFYNNYAGSIISELTRAARVKVFITTPAFKGALPEKFRSEAVLVGPGWLEKLLPKLAPSSAGDGGSATKELIPALSPPNLDPRATMAMLAMTSGTTGLPKCIMCSHHCCLVNFLARQSLFPYANTKGDSDARQEREALSIMFLWELPHPLLHGQTMVIVPDDVIVDARRFIRWLRKSKISRVLITPSLCANILDQPSIQGRSLAKQLASLRTMLLCGEVVPQSLPPRVHKALPHVRLLDDYSTWEGLDTTYNGVPNPRVTIYCVDPETGRPVPRGTPGEIRVGGDTLSQGYMGDEAKTKKKFVPNTVPVEDHEEISAHFLSAVPVPQLQETDVTVARAAGCTPSESCRVDNLASSSSSASSSFKGYQYKPPALVYLTGDRGEITKDGRLRIYGRADDTIKIRGFKVPLPMVEEALTRLPGIVSAKAVPVKDPETDQPVALVGFVVIDREAEPFSELVEGAEDDIGANDDDDDSWLEYKATKDLIESLRTVQLKELLPAYAVPSALVGLKQMPMRVGMGKLDKKALLARIPDWLKPKTTRVAPKAAVAAESVSKKLTDDEASAAYVAMLRAIVASKQNHIPSLVPSVRAAFVEALGHGNFEDDESFFDAGGQSLTAATLVGLIFRDVNVGIVPKPADDADDNDDDEDEGFEIEIAVVELFSNPTVLLLSTYLADKINERKQKAMKELESMGLLSPVVSGGLNVQNGEESKSESDYDYVYVERPLQGARDPRMFSGHVAVVGMGGRFPTSLPSESCDVKGLWKLLCSGGDALRRFSRNELIDRGVPASTLDNTDYVCAGQALGSADATTFDAFFFGIGGSEARLIDPQQRLFLQIAWEAIEDAGYSPRTLDATARRDQHQHTTGVFAACGIDGYLHHHLESRPLKDAMAPGTVFMAETGSEKDYIATRVSYQLNLKGPSFNVNSACSSGLVAIARAVAAISAGECDAALAGASSITFPNSGYRYSDGLVSSRDGTVRPFDAGASGTLFGDSCGGVFLKRVEDALADGDSMYAIVKGHAVTNDGRDKAGFAAPKAEAQARAIVRARNMAGVTSRETGFIECHATATHVGDAIEVSGLMIADEMMGIDRKTSSHLRGVISSGAAIPKPATTSLGSIKGNIGHANCAAGITGFIKACLCVKSATLVPTAHFSKLNAKIAPIIEGKEYEVNTKLRSWPVQDFDGRCVAGISSFGVGGTNAHVVIEAPGPSSAHGVKRVTKPAHGNAVPLILSAKTRSSLAIMCMRMSEYLSIECKRPQDPKEGDLLANTSFTLFSGREQLRYRVAVTVGANDVAAAAKEFSMISNASESDAETNPAFVDSRPGSRGGAEGQGGIVLLFPGQGSQHLGMGQGLYTCDPAFRTAFNRCCAVVDPSIRSALEQKWNFAFAQSGRAPPTDLGLRDVIFSTSFRVASKGEECDFEHGPGLTFRREAFALPSVLQPALFAVEFSAFAALSSACGSETTTPIVAACGHSLGEYVAACIAGAFGPPGSDEALQAALGAVLVRARACEDDGGSGAMLSFVTPPRQKTLGPGDTAFDAVVSEANGARNLPAGVIELLALHKGLCVATVNSPRHFALSGSVEIVDAAIASIAQANGEGADPRCGVASMLGAESALRGCRGSKLKVNRAFHSPAMTGPADALEKHLRGRKIEAKKALLELAFPVASNVTGEWMQEKQEVEASELKLSDLEMTASSTCSPTLPPCPIGGGNPFSPSYWAQHMRRPVLFRENIASLRRRFPSAVFVECGPGNSLTKLRAKCLKSPAPSKVADGPSIELMRHAKTGTDARAAALDSQVFVSALCKLWTRGVRGVDPTRSNMIGGQRSHIPGYAFQKTVFWENARASVYGQLEDDEESEDEEGEERDNDEGFNEEKGEHQETTSSSPRLVAISHSEGTALQITRPLFLVCFPFAGGSARAFASSTAWTKSRTLSRTVQIYAVELPGRGARAEDPLMRTAEAERAEVEAIAADIAAAKGESGVVLCGLSMGANFAVAVAHQLIATGYKESIEGVCVVGRAPPAPLHAGQSLDENGGFAGDIDAYAMVPDAVRMSRAWEEHYGPLLRADLGTDLRLSSTLHMMLNRVKETEKEEKGGQVANTVRFDVFCGLDDSVSKWKLAEGWRSLGIATMLGVDAGSNFSVRCLGGEHSFMTEQADAIVHSILAMHGAQEQALLPTAVKLGAPVAREKSAGLTNGPQPTPLLGVEWEKVGTLDLGFDESATAPVPVVTSAGDALTKVQEAVAYGGCIFAAHGSSEEDSAWNLITLAKAIVTNNVSASGSPHPSSPCRIVVLAERTTAKGAGAIGASRCAGMEFPTEVVFQRIFVDPVGKTIDLDRLWSLAAHALPSEPDIRLVPLSGEDKSFSVHVRRLRALAEQTALSGSLPVFTKPAEKRTLVFKGFSPLSAVGKRDAGEKSEAAYIVSGATGGIGAALIRWMVSDQDVEPRRIVALTRNSSGEGAARLRSLFPGLEICEADLAADDLFCNAALRAAVERATGGGAKNEGYLDCIFHLAGMLDDGLLLNMTAERVCRVMRPKSAALYNLLSEETPTWLRPKGAVVAFSSTTSLLGYAGQANYGAANSCMDRLANCRSLSGDNNAPRVLCINWGPWAEVGMAQVGTKAYREALRGGELPLPSADALGALGNALQRFRHNGGTEPYENVAQVAICRADWPSSVWRGSPAVASLQRALMPEPVQGKGEQEGKPKKEKKRKRRKKGTKGNAGKNRSVVEAFLADRVSMWAPTETLSALGVDSLDEVQLRNEFQEKIGVSVPLSVFVAPSQTLGRLCEELTKRYQAANGEL